MIIKNQGVIPSDEPPGDEEAERLAVFSVSRNILTEERYERAQATKGESPVLQDGEAALDVGNITLGLLFLQNKI